MESLHKMVRRLEQSNETLKEENKKLREELAKRKEDTSFNDTVYRWMIKTLEKDLAKAQLRIAEFIRDQEGGENQEGDWDGVFYNDWWIIVRHEWEEVTIREYDEQGGTLMNREEAIEHCKDLQDRHLPTIEERQKLLRIWCGINWYTTYDNNVYWSDNNNIPVGQKFADDMRLSFDIAQGSDGYYWSSSPYGSTNPSHARNLLLNSSNVYTVSNYHRANARSVRCFKNS